MIDLEKMLESLSRSDINYRHILDTDTENEHLENSMSGHGYGAGHAKKTKFRFIPGILFSLMIIGGAGLYISNIRNTAPLVNSTAETMPATNSSVISEDKSYMELFGLDSEAEEIHFSLIGTYEEYRGAYVDEMNGSYIISDKSKCEDILLTLTYSRTEKRVNDEQDDFLSLGDPYAISIENSDVIRIYLTLSEDTRVIIKSDGQNETLGINKNGGDTVYYELASGTCNNITKTLMKQIKNNNEYKNESISPEIEIPETMKFKAVYSSMGPTSEYLIEDSQICSYIIDLLSDNCAERSDKYIINVPGNEISTDTDYDYNAFPYYYDINVNGSEYVLRPEQIEFTIPDSNTRLIVLDYKFNDFLLVIRDNTKTYYKLRDCVYYEIADITENIINAAIEKITCALYDSRCELYDSLGNEIPISDITPNSVDQWNCDFMVSFDLSETAAYDIPDGIYTVPDGEIYVIDKSGNVIDLMGYGFKASITRENTYGKKFLNILIIAEAWPETDLSGCTLKGTFNSINKEDSGYTLNFSFEHNL